MLVRVMNGVMATVAIVTFGQCQTPTDPPAAASTTTVARVVPAVVTTVVGERSRLTPTLQIPTVTFPSTTTSTTLVPAGLLPAPQWSSWPSWRVTAEGVPYYRGRTACTVAQAGVIAAEFAARGASLDTQRWAIYVASREAGCDHTAVNIGRTDNSHGTHQLNAKGNGPLSPAGVLGQLGWTPAKVTASLQSSARAAADLWAICGKGPWVKGDYGCRRPTS